MVPTTRSVTFWLTSNHHFNSVTRHKIVTSDWNRRISLLLIRQPKKDLVKSSVLKEIKLETTMHPDLESEETASRCVIAGRHWPSSSFDHARNDFITKGYH
nr:PREDICTED: uncharacterized protein LOC109040285 [Bemisia tabaci]